MRAPLRRLPFRSGGLLQSGRFGTEYIQLKPGRGVQGGLGHRPGALSIKLKPGADSQWETKSLQGFLAHKK